MKYRNLSQRTAGITLVLCLSGSMACGNGSVTTDTCPRKGTVAADLRDLERDAEGVSYAVFGAAPDRVPDFARAQGVLSLLKTVWAAGKTECPGLPTGSQANVDAAIARVEAALNARDQKAAAYAANDIHLETAPIFDYFHPETSIAVVAMDANFLRIGVDAWFEDWTAFDHELTALQRDWDTLKARATAHVPTCHRVAGTATVVGDIDDTLGRLAAMSTSHDKGAAQVSSEDGLLEVDILELLFDCVPDGTTPDAGIGSSCETNTDCETGQVCDTRASGRVCAPDAENTHVGAACETTVDCGSDPRAACANQVGDGFPGGYCVMEPCDDIQVCSPGATCISMPFETPSCMESCTADTDCRVDEGYVCQLFPTTPPIGFGPSDHACAYACDDDAGCTAPLTCDVASGRCIP